MPHFDQYGGDEWICQICGRIQDSRTPCQSRKDITEIQSAGNVCPDCIQVNRLTGLTGQALREKAAEWLQRETRPIGLEEHARRESGLEGRALRNYIRRHYVDDGLEG